jgi:CRISPR-associated protein Cmr3
MSVTLEQQAASEASSQSIPSPSFKYTIAITPLGLLYGSAGRFLSPDHLVGRAGQHFPPDAAAIAGLFMAANQEDLEFRKQLYVTGPFWAKQGQLDNFYVPTPHSFLTQNKKIKHRISRQPDGWRTWSDQHQGWIEPPDKKFDKNTWITINDWQLVANQGEKDSVTNSVENEAPWKTISHLHPELNEDERCTKEGRLFLESAVQLDPEACLVYLASHPLEDGCYRFGGEGHMVEISCQPLSKEVENLLSQPLGHDFALVTPAVWGSNRLSERYPQAWGKSVQLLTRLPVPFRYRLGKKLSRGRYAVPAGTVYHCPEEKPPWQNWDVSWFPKEGISLQQLGCGLALPLKIVSQKS